MGGDDVVPSPDLRFLGDPHTTAVGIQPKAGGVLVQLPSDRALAVKIVSSKIDDVIPSVTVTRHFHPDGMRMGSVSSEIRHFGECSAIIPYRMLTEHESLVVIAVHGPFEFTVESST